MQKRMAGGPFAPLGTLGVTAPEARVVPEVLSNGLVVETTVVALSNFAIVIAAGHPVDHENVNVREP